MARIPENEVERLKKEISVLRLAEARGIKLTRQGANLLGRCPFHDDRAAFERHGTEGSVAKVDWLREDGLNSSGAGHVRGSSGVILKVRSSFGRCVGTAAMGLAIVTSSR